jgi:hypothetical protein
MPNDSAQFSLDVSATPSEMRDVLSGRRAVNKLRDITSKGIKLA